MYSKFCFKVIHIFLIFFIVFYYEKIENDYVATIKFPFIESFAHSHRAFISFRFDFVFLITCTFIGY